MEMMATTAFGIEAVVRRELEELNIKVDRVENGKVFFSGDENDLIKANLWLRCADRVLIVVGEFEATSFDELFEKTRALPWEEWIHREGIFPVDGKSVKSKLFSISDCQRIVKKAIASRLGEYYKTSWLEETESRYRIQVSLLNDQATLTIDSSGVGLHKRGYRDQNAIAPLKETLAAALILLSFWNPSRMLADLFCGSGTIVIEAAMMGMNMAPGLNRSFDFMSWPRIQGKLDGLANEARDLVEWDKPLEIIGSDYDLGALKLANRHVEQAGVEDKIRIIQADFRKLPLEEDYGVWISNPPYGERMGEIKEVEAMYRDLGPIFSSLPTWSKYIITSHRGFERLSGLKADRKRKLYNGRIQCNYYQYQGPRPPDHI